MKEKYFNKFCHKTLQIFHIYSKQEIVARKTVLCNSQDQFEIGLTNFGQHTLTHQHPGLKFILNSFKSNLMSWKEGYYQLTVKLVAKIFICRRVYPLTSEWMPPVRSVANLSTRWRAHLPIWCSKGRSPPPPRSPAEQMEIREIDWKICHSVDTKIIKGRLEDDMWQWCISIYTYLNTGCFFFFGFSQGAVNQLY